MSDVYLWLGLERSKNDDDDEEEVGEVCAVQCLSANRTEI